LTYIKVALSEASRLRLSSFCALGGRMERPVNWRGRLPVIARCEAELSGSERTKALSLAKEFIAQSRHREERFYFEPYARLGVADTQFVFIGDASEIPLLARPDTNPLEYRLSILAGEGDLVIIGGQRNHDFENYLEHHLDLGHRNYLQVGQTFQKNGAPVSVRCLKDAGTYASLRTHVEKLGAVTLVPHISTGAIWALARQLGKDIGRSIHVAGPLPTMSILANNKLWFAQVVRRLFGEDAVPAEVSAFGAAALAARVHSFGQSCSKLVVKIPDSAGSKGNFPISSSEISGMGMKELHQYLVDLLSKTNGQTHYPLMVQVWEKNVLINCSAQLWIPHPANGSPVVEGIFEQLLTGPKGCFSGASPTRIPEGWNKKLAHDALMLGQVFQELGYFGRCSFDAVISGDDFGSAKLQWIECNGRWGGVSVPMTFLNQLFRGLAPPPHVIAHRSKLVLPFRSFSEGLEVLKDLLWHPGDTEGVIFMTPSGFEEGMSLHFLSLAATIKQADRQAEEVIQRLTKIH